MPTQDEVSQVLPSAALTATLYGFWVNAVRDKIKEAHQVKYVAGKDEARKKATKSGRIFAIASLPVPVAVTAILSPLVLRITKSWSFSKDYSVINSLFTLIFVLWCGTILLAFVDIWRVESAACKAQKEKRKDDPGSS